MRAPRPKKEKGYSSWRDKRQRSKSAKKRPRR